MNYIIRYLTILIVFSLSFTNCKKNDPASSSEPAQGDDGTTKIPSYTKVIGDSDFQKYFVSISTDSSSFTFNSALGNTYHFSKGDILIIPNGEGLLRKITNVVNSGNQVIIETEQGQISEAIEKGSVNFSAPLSELAIENVQYFTKGIQITNLDKLNKNSKVNAIDFKIDAVLYDHDGNENTKSDQVVTTGTFSFGPKLNGIIDIANFKFNKLQLDFEFQEKLSQTLKISFINIDAIKAEKKLAQIKFKSFLINIGAVPIWVTPVLTVKAGLNINVNSSLTTGIVQDYKYTTGIKLENSAWKTYKTIEQSFTYDAPKLNANLEAQFYIKPEFDLKIYGTLAPYVYADVFGKFNAKIFDSPWWKLSAGVDVGVGIKAKVLSKTLFDFYGPVISFETIVGQASGALDDINIIQPDKSSIWVQGQQNVSIKWNTGSLGGNVKIDLYKDQDFISTIVNSTQNNGFYQSYNLSSTIQNGNTYRIKISHLENSSKYAFSDQFLISAEASNKPPNPPSNLKADVISSKQIDLNWQDNSNIESGFKLERRKDENGTWSEIARLGANITKYSDQSVEQKSNYYYRILSYNSNGNSVYSNIQNAQTPESEIPNPPTELTATAKNAFRIDLAWKDNSSNETGFKLERQTGPSGTFTEIKQLPEGTTSYSDQNLQPTTEYYYRLRGFNAKGDGAYSITVSATTPTYDPLVAPTNLKASLNGYTTDNQIEIYLEWDDLATNETGYKVYNGIASTVFPINTSSASIKVPWGYQYTFKVTAFNNDGESAPSNSITIAAQYPPFDLNADLVSSNQINVSWNSEKNASSYYLVYKEDIASGWTYKTPSAKNYSITGLQPNKNYQIKVRAKLIGSGYTDYSETIQATTNSELPKVFGVVQNSVDGKPIAGATISSDDGKSGTTDSQGKYELSVTTGLRRITASKSGFYSYYKDYDVQSTGSNELNFALSPQAGNIVNRIVLTWGSVPSDLDLHLITPSINGISYEVYWKSKGSATNDPFAMLDIDDTTSYGPETITLYKAYKGIYKVYVWNYLASQGLPGIPSLTSSNAVIDIYSKTGLLKSINVPISGVGYVWYVCDIDAETGTVTVQNKIQKTLSKQIRIYKK